MQHQHLAAADMAQHVQACSSSQTQWSGVLLQHPNPRVCMQTEPMVIACNSCVADVTNAPIAPPPQLLTAAWEQADSHWYGIKQPCKEQAAATPHCAHNK
jgi:hypothetical protein